jgi:cell division GTPase FtsZ
VAKTSYVPSGAKIKVVGLGGAGCNAITRMVREQIRGVEFIAMNTDAQALAITEAAVRIQVVSASPAGSAPAVTAPWAARRLRKAVTK